MRRWLGGLAALLAMPAQPALAQTAQADDLPAQLLAAARLMPDTRGGRRVCIGIQGLTDRLRLGAVSGDAPGPADGGETYSATTQGAYLGDGPTGEPAPPFVQALLDAGAARRLTLTWMRQGQAPAMAPSQLQDTGTARPAAGRPARVPSAPPMATYRGDAYLVTGPDQALFARDQPSMLALDPPRLLPSSGAAAPGNSGVGAPPPGVWAATQVCTLLVPERVLEYGDVEDHGNGVSEVAAAVLFHPDRVPAWISDPRVVDTLTPNMRPVDVRTLLFRNDGDGWRYNGPNPWATVRGKSHIVEPE